MERAELSNGTPPHITCPGPQLVEAQQTLGAGVAFTEATATDDSTRPPAITYSRSRGSFFPFGKTTVTATARDAAGLTDTCSFDVTVRDTTPPDVVCPASATIEAVDKTGALVTFADAVASDAVTRQVTPVLSRASGSRFPLGSTTVTATATDGAGNTNQCTFTLTVSDTTAAMVSCPADQTVEAENATGALATWPPAEVSDAVSVPTLTYDHPSGDRFPLGTTPVVATARDTAGNTSSCTFRVIIRDTTAPTLKCPSPVQVEALGPSGALAEFVVINYVDTVSTVSVSTEPASGDTFPVGTTSVRVEARDVSGNVATCTFPVAVVNTLPPLLTCPQDVSASNGPAAVQLPSPSVKDRVTGSPSISMEPGSGSIFQPGDTPVEVTARDEAGNTSRCTFTVHVEKASGGCSSAPGRTDASVGLSMLALLMLAARRSFRGGTHE